jgi:hypothetical protein
MVVKIQNHSINYVADPVLEIKKQDWIILRLLYLITAIDPSMNKVDEIIRTKQYINSRYKPYMDTAKDDLIERAFWMISKDPVAQDTFSNIKDVRLVREFKNTFKDDKKDDGVTYFGTVNYTLRPGTRNE